MDRGGWWIADGNAHTLFIKGKGVVEVLLHFNHTPLVMSCGWGELPLPNKKRRFIAFVLSIQNSIPVKSPTANYKWYLTT